MKKILTFLFMMLCLTIFSITAVDKLQLVSASQDSKPENLELNSNIPFYDYDHIWYTDEVGQLGLGKQLLDPNDIGLNSDYTGNKTTFMFSKYLPIPAKTVYCLYVAPWIMQMADSFNEAYPIMTYWKDDMKEEAVEEIIDLRNGGWGGYIYIENKTNATRYFAISSLEIRISYDDIPLTADNILMLQKEPNTSTLSFNGYYDYIGQEDYTQATETRYFYTYTGSNLTEADILKLFKARDNGYDVSLSIENNQYKDAEGEYPVTIVATDANNNQSKYTLMIRVINQPIPTINGPDTITYYLSKNPAITLNKLLANYTSDYCGVSGTLSLTEDSKFKFYGVIGNHSETTLTLIATFTGGRVATKDIKLVIVDDIAPTIYVTEFTLTTLEANALSLAQLVEHIEKSYKNLYNKNPNEIVIVQNSYTGNEDEAGVYYVTYKCVFGEEEEMGRLKIVVNSTNNKNDNNYKSIYLGLGVGFGAIILLAGAILIQKRRHNK